MQKLLKRLSIGSVLLILCGGWIETSESTFSSSGGDQLPNGIAGAFMCFDYGDDGAENHKRKIDINEIIVHGVAQYQLSPEDVGSESFTPWVFKRAGGDRYMVAYPSATGWYIESASIIDQDGVIKITLYSQLFGPRIESLASVHNVTIEPITDTANMVMSGNVERQRAFAMALADDATDVQPRFECNKK